jgi:hypothetical protein
MRGSVLQRVAYGVSIRTNHRHQSSSPELKHEYKLDNKYGHQRVAAAAIKFDPALSIGLMFAPSLAA